MGWNISMAVFRGEDPVDELYRLLRALQADAEHGRRMVERGTLVDGYEATGRDFEGIGLGTFGPCALLVGSGMHWLHGPVIEGSTLALTFFASENRGGTNEISVHVGGRTVASWYEAGELEPGTHPLLEDLPEELHPFDRVEQVVERVLGAKPVEVLERPLFLLR